MNLTNQNTSETDLDSAILTFALNLEYLEAEYYLRATTGAGVDAQIGEVKNAETSGSVTIKPNPKVPFKTGFVEDAL
jgi:hypothetical protein